MSGRFVRASKYRHVFGRSTRREQCYDNLRISKNAFDTNLVKANPRYLAVNWEASGGGAFAVIPLEEKGKLPELLPLFRGHTSAVLDTDWNPFHDDIIASASDDAKVFLWKVPEHFTLYTDAEEPADVKPVGKLSGHSRKVGHVLFNPAAENVLASSSGDASIKIWDLENGKSKLTLHGDMVQSLSWNATGTMLVTTSRDKKLRFWDVRTEKAVQEVSGHAGAKNSRTVWLGEHDRVVTTGFSRMSERQMGLWDVRNPTKPIGGDFQLLDSSSGIAMPFWDDGCNMLYIAGKGDGNIRYYEYENDKFEFLAEYKSGDPQRGLAFLPKRAVNTRDNEVMRAFKTVNDAYIEPISFIVPRRAETFQEDIYPPATGPHPAVSSAEWFDGKDGLPPKISMEDVFEGNEPKVIAAEETPKATATRSAPEPAPAAAPKPATPQSEPASTPSPAATREMPSVNDNKQSMAAMASKFADKNNTDEDEKNSESSFEEISKPVERPSVIAAREREAGTSKTTTPDTRTPTQPSSANGLDAASTKPAADTDAPKENASPAVVSATAPNAVSAAGGLRDTIQEIRDMLSSHTKEIESLRAEVVSLKSKLGE